MSTLDPHQARQQEGGRRKDAAHALLEARRVAYVRRARRALLGRLLLAGTATADDVADAVGPIPPDIDPRWLGPVPGHLARAGIIRPIGYTKSDRASRHASVLTVWELADRSAALAWLAHHPDLPEPDDGEAGTPCPMPDPSSPTPFLTQQALFT